MSKLGATIFRAFGYLTRSRMALVAALIWLGIGLLLGMSARGGLILIEGPFNSAPGDLGEATAALGQSVPEVRWLPVGMIRSGIGVDPADKPIGPRYVHIAYALDGKNVARLSVWRGEIALQNQSERMVIGNALAWVSTTKHPDGSENVNYSWGSDGLVIQLDVHLVSGVSRETSDRMAGSVR